MVKRIIARLTRKHKRQIRMTLSDYLDYSLAIGHLPEWGQA